MAPNAFTAPHRRLALWVVLPLCLGALPLAAQTADRPADVTAMRAQLIAGAPPVEMSQALDPDVLDHIVTLLSGYEYFPTADDLLAVIPDPTPYLLHIAYDPDGRWLPTHHHRAVAALAYFPSDAVRAHLDYLLTSPDTPDLMRHHVIDALATGFGDSALPELEPFLQNPDVQLRLTAVSAIGSIRTDRAAQVLRSALTAEPNTLVQERIQGALTSQPVRDLR